MRYGLSLIVAGTFLASEVALQFIGREGLVLGVMIAIAVLALRRR